MLVHAPHTQAHTHKLARAHTHAQVQTIQAYEQGNIIPNNALIARCVVEFFGGSE